MEDEWYQYCPMCDEDTLHKALGKAGSTVVGKCDNCGHVHRSDNDG